MGLANGTTKETHGQQLYSSDKGLANGTTKEKHAEKSNLYSSDKSLANGSTKENMRKSPTCTRVTRVWLMGVHRKNTGNPLSSE